MFYSLMGRFLQKKKTAHMTGRIFPVAGQRCANEAEWKVSRKTCMLKRNLSIRGRESRQYEELCNKRKVMWNRNIIAER